MKANIILNFYSCTETHNAWSLAKNTDIKIGTARIIGKVKIHNTTVVSPENKKWITSAANTKTKARTLTNRITKFWGIFFAHIGF